jgi:hypothetical protein
VHPDKIHFTPSLFRNFFWMHAAPTRLVLIKLNVGLQKGNSFFEDREFEEVTAYFMLKL